MERVGDRLNVLIIQSCNDNETEESLIILNSDSRLKRYKFDYCYALILNKADRNLLKNYRNSPPTYEKIYTYPSGRPLHGGPISVRSGPTDPMIEIQNRPFSKEDFYKQICKKIKTFKPKIVFIHTGFMYKKHKDIFNIVIDQIKGKYEHICFCFEGNLESVMNYPIQIHKNDFDLLYETIFG
jgi:hypothetical protein